MNIDTKRLASDPGYWRECGAGNYQFAFTTGPEWDGAFEYIGRVEFADEDGRQGSDIWSPRLQIGPKSWTLVAVRPQEDDAADQEKRILVETFVAGPGRDLIILGDSERVMRHGDRVEIYLTRAQSPEVEWDGSGRPPIGIWVEHNKHGHSVTTRIVGYDGILPVCSHGEGKYYGVPISCMRPIRTKERRQRDEVIAAAEHAIESHGGAVASSTHLEWLYDVGMLRKPEGE